MIQKLETLAYVQYTHTLIYKTYYYINYDDINIIQQKFNGNINK